MASSPVGMRSVSTPRSARCACTTFVHTTASQAIMSGESFPLVGKLLGHRRNRTTAGYAHLADKHLVETADRVGSIIAEAMNGTHG